MGSRHMRLTLRGSTLSGWALFTLIALVVGTGPEGKSMTAIARSIQRQTPQARVTLVSCDWANETAAPSYQPRVVQVREFNVRDVEGLSARLISALPVRNLSPFGYGALVTGAAPNDAWMKDEVLIRVFVAPQQPTEPLAIQVKVSFEDVRSGQLFAEQVRVDKDEGVAVLFKAERSKRAVGVLILASAPETKAELYCTEYKSERFTIYSEDRSWKETPDSQDTMTFHQAKAVIPAQGDKLTLQAEKLVYSKKTSELIAYNAIILDGLLKQVVRGEQIRLTLEKEGVRYEVVNK